jgi:maltose phosphorylase
MLGNYSGMRLREKIMINIISADEWKIVIDHFSQENKRLVESIFSLGNGHMGLRGFFEEEYTGDSLQGTYLAGVYYLDKTKVGWWKNGFTESFAKVINSTNWVGINIKIDGQSLDLNRFQVQGFSMTLDMKTGLLSRSFLADNGSGKLTKFTFKRFLSMENRNIACVSVIAEPVNYSGTIAFEPYLDGDVVNEDSNYDEKFWVEIDRQSDESSAALTMETLKTKFRQSTAMYAKLISNGKERNVQKIPLLREKYAGQRITAEFNCGIAVEFQKFVSVCTSRDFSVDQLQKITREKLKTAAALGWEELFKRHCKVLAQKWNECDVVIQDDVKAQQGIRYNIFQLNQTYTGDDPRLNLGPKGFTGEKYWGGTYWDTEAFCLPFYLYTNASIARNLLYYRYLQLENARGNAKRLGLKGALYPMVTMDGVECHNEWEITFEELHRNGAIAYSIYNYTQYTGDMTFVDDYGIEELIEISRFYASRVTYNSQKDKYMMLGVTGPNEYENNVNNNWYTNMLSAWVMDYTRERLENLKRRKPERCTEVIKKLGINTGEVQKWSEISEKMYYPYVEELGIFEQQDLYMDKEQQLVKDIPESELPLNKHWSWDRILRSCFIKQADVIQAFYFFPFQYDMACKKRNFDFYEPRTVHESSLSASVYSIVASQIGYKQKAYELYLRTSRLDLDNYNADTEDGVHLTSMSGSWLAIVQGFAEIYANKNRLTMKPYIPEQWSHYSFKMDFRGSKLAINVNKTDVSVELLEGKPIDVLIYDQTHHIEKSVLVPMPKEVLEVQA